MNKVIEVIDKAIIIGVTASMPVPRYPEKKHESGVVPNTKLSRCIGCGTVLTSKEKEAGTCYDYPMCMRY